MTHDKVFKYGTCKESQYGYQFAQKIRFSLGGGNNSVVPIRALEASGLSVHKRSRVCRQTDSCARPENSFHGQTLRKSHARYTTICPIEGANDKRSSYRSFGSLTLQRPEEWLSQRERKEQLNWNISLTGWHHARSAKRTIFLSLINVGVPILTARL
jgi:hypothetical protein